MGVGVVEARSHESCSPRSYNGEGPVIDELFFFTSASLNVVLDMRRDVVPVISLALRVKGGLVTHCKIFPLAVCQSRPPLREGNALC